MKKMTGRFDIIVYSYTGAQLFDAPLRKLQLYFNPSWARRRRLPSLKLVTVPDPSWRKLDANDIVFTLKEED